MLRPVKHVLLDFDGPVCSVFAGLPAPEAAARLPASLADAGLIQLPDGPVEGDPLALLRQINEEHREAVGLADRTLAAVEAEAVRMAVPTPGGESVLRACAESGRCLDRE